MELELDTIYNMDCLEGMKYIPDGSIDAIICDLPYGTTANKWDSVIPFEPLWEQYKRIIKTRGAVVLFCQQPFTSAVVMSNPKLFKYEWIWMKEQGTGILNSHYAPMKIHENICVFSSAAAAPSSTGNNMVYNPQMTSGTPYRCVGGKNGSSYGKTHNVMVDNNGERYPIDIVRFQRDPDTFHPTQKPVDLLRYLVLTYTNEGDTVLDNCMGSGTTAIACLREHRHFIGFEMDTEYYQKSLSRIDKEKSQLTLF